MRFDPAITRRTAVGGAAAMLAATACKARVVMRDPRSADFVVLSEDPLRVEADRLKDIEIVRTVTGGRTTYSA